MDRHEELINEIHLARKRFDDLPRDVSREDMDILLDELELMSVELRNLQSIHRQFSN